MSPARCAALAEHAHDVAAVADHAVDRSEPGDPIRRAGPGTDVQVYLGHLRSLAEAMLTFCALARDRLEEMPAPPAD